VWPMTADFARVYPPYTWIPASAGMTNGACRGAQPLCVSSLSPKIGVDLQQYAARSLSEEYTSTGMT